MKFEALMIMLCDNHNAIKMEKILVFKGMTKHVEITSCSGLCEENIEKN
jgi:hypothetical protein